MVPVLGLDDVFVVERPFVNKSPEVLSVHCSDGRFRHAHNRLLDRYGVHVDVVAIPGGIGNLDENERPAFQNIDNVTLAHIDEVRNLIVQYGLTKFFEDLLGVTPENAANLHVHIGDIAVLARIHNINHMSLVAHQGCGFYKETYPEWSNDERYQKQIRDLVETAGMLRRLTQVKTIELQYAYVENERVVFKRFPVAL